MTEERKPSKTQQLWNSAVKAVKGENTAELVETFTSEMTLIAEGLCEDQSRLRASLDEIAGRQEKAEARSDSELQALEQELQENWRDMQHQMDELSDRVTALEKSGKNGREKKAGFLSGSFMQQLTLIVSIGAGAWVLVTILNLFK